MYVLFYYTLWHDSCPGNGEPVRSQSHILDLLDARVERFGELTYGIFYHGAHDSLAEWASGIKNAFPEDAEDFEGGVSVGVAPFLERHEGADALRSEATAALQESFQSGECVIVG